jgi:hypothetical protein
MGPVDFMESIVDLDISTYPLRNPMSPNPNLVHLLCIRGVIRCWATGSHGYVSDYDSSRRLGGISKSESGVWGF